MPKRSIVMTSAALISMTMTGCSAMSHSGPGYKPEVKPVEQARQQARKYSSAILKYSGLKAGTTTPTGPLASLDADGVERGYYMDHSWSVYNVPDQSLGQAFERIHSALPGGGWKIVKYGPAKDQAHTPTIDAEHDGDHFTVTIKWIQKSTEGGALLAVTLNSPIYIAPPGTDMNSVG